MATRTFPKFLTIGLLAPAALLASSSIQAANNTINLGATVRDFHASHPDFEGDITGLKTGLVTQTLPADKKPDFTGISGGAITSTATFDQWYQDVLDINMNKDITLTLEETAPNSGVFTFSDNAFFPIDNDLFGNEGNSHNYHFTLELHSTFTYLGGETFDFSGDDDLWVYINNDLVIDLGGIHTRESGSVNLDTLGLTTGESYDFSLFFAERHTVLSEFTMSTSIGLEPTPPVPVPGAVWLFGSGLLGLIGLKRRSRVSA